ncbi:hypothetical protein HPB50_006109 [Hyalomma asiaticum]|uniref:Uncharacterized protein n=1 Tax=Hyalomma asiaticum TaxID=266040 RepID=A0ACB7SNH1_HYAAI|nr:hypothetical protein HPB50_006109 [Hyalomma asiaticum]
MSQAHRRLGVCNCNCVECPWEDLRVVFTWMSTPHMRAGCQGHQQFSNSFHLWPRAQGPSSQDTSSAGTTTDTRTIGSQVEQVRAHWNVYLRVLRLLPEKLLRQLP